MLAKLRRSLATALIAALSISIISTPPARAAAGSLLFNGANYLAATASNSKFNFGTGDFTIEWWQKLNSSTNNSASRIFAFGCYSSQQLQASEEGGTLYLGINGGWAASVSLSNYQDKWSHLAIVRSSGTLKVYQNGTQILSTSYANSIDVSSYNMAVGAEFTNCTSRSVTHFGGKLAKLRMVKSAVYTAAFTPSSTYGLVANTIFMLDADTAAPLTDTGNTGTAVTFTNTGSTGVASDSEVPALPKLSQSTLSITQSTVAYKNALSLTTSGGSTGGSVTFTYVSGPCSISGSTLTPSGAGTCVVNATMAGDATYDPVTSANKSITITAQALTISGISIANKTYNGTTAASIVGTPTLVGLIAGDTLTFTTGSATAVFANATVGANKAVTVSGYSISGGNASGYTLSQPTGLTASILAGVVPITPTAPVTSSYRAPTNIAISTGTVAGKVTFYQGRNRIPGCINKPVTSASGYAIACSWKPTGAGLVRPYAIFTPNDSNYSPVTFYFAEILVSRRTTPK